MLPSQWTCEAKASSSPQDDLAWLRFRVRADRDDAVLRDLKHVFRDRVSRIAVLFDHDAADATEKLVITIPDDVDEIPARHNNTDRPAVCRRYKIAKRA